MVEEGFKDFVFATDMVLLAPAKTPPDAVKWLESRNAQGPQHGGNERQTVQAGFQVRPKGAAAAWERVMKEVDLFKDVIDQAGIKKL